MSSLQVVVAPNGPEVLLTRVFDAPKDLVFSIFIDPARISQWWGPRGHTTTVDKMDVRPGGA